MLKQNEKDDEEGYVMLKKSKLAEQWFIKYSKGFHFSFSFFLFPSFSVFSVTVHIWFLKKSARYL